MTCKNRNAWSTELAQEFPELDEACATLDDVPYTLRMKMLDEETRRFFGREARRSPRAPESSQMSVRDAVRHFTPTKWFELVRAFDDKCVYCTADTQLGLDLLVPIAAGGTVSPSNLVPACATCRRSKRARDTVEWVDAKKLSWAAISARIAAARIRQRERPHREKAA